MFKKYLFFGLLVVSLFIGYVVELFFDLLFEECGIIIKDVIYFDWIWFNFGEWFKGEFVLMYDKEFEFDSDVFDILMIDCEDIYMIIFECYYIVCFNDGEEFSGILNILGGYVKVGDVFVKYCYCDLVFIVLLIDSEFSVWIVKILLGVDLFWGNID